ncbi:hypothetical protein ECFDA506_2254, partial [Escherichia coli FDA506]
FPPPPRR